MMKEMTTKVYTGQPDPNKVNNLADTFRRSLSGLRSKSSPVVGVVSNFDPDYRQTVTDAMQGYTMLQQQVGGDTVGRVAVHGDYGVIPPGQSQPMRPVPGQPTVIYPVGSGTGVISLSFIKGGKVDYRRVYPALDLIRNTRIYTFGDAGNAGTNSYTTGNCVFQRGDTLTFLSPNLDYSWNENSPLPPGMRYYDLEVRAAQFLHGQFFRPIAPGAEMPPGFNIGMVLARGSETLAQLRARLIRSSVEDDPFTDYDSYMPHDSLGNIRYNFKLTPVNVFYHLTEEFNNDDSYWTGEVRDPLNWQDAYWDGLDRDPTGNTPRVDRTALKTWLVAHPAAVITS